MERPHDTFGSFFTQSLTLFLEATFDRPPNGDLVVPSTRLKTGERAFSVAAPQAWNRLPVELKTMVDTARFKRELKTLPLLEISNLNF